MSIIYFVLGVLGAYVLWYRPFYRALRSSILLDLVCSARRHCSVFVIQAEPPQIVVASVGSLCQMIENFLKLEAMRILAIDEAEVLYKLVEDWARLRGDSSEIVLDLFCGTGSIGLSLAERVKHVYGFEVVAEAVSDAQRNAKLNGIQNATFVQGDLNKTSDSFGKDFPKPNIVITGCRHTTSWISNKGRPEETLW